MPSPAVGRTWVSRWRLSIAVGVWMAVGSVSCGGRQVATTGPATNIRPEGAPCSVDGSWEQAPSTIGERPPEDRLRERYCRSDEEGSAAEPATERAPER